MNAEFATEMRTKGHLYTIERSIMTIKDDNDLKARV